MVAVFEAGHVVRNGRVEAERHVRVDVDAERLRTSKPDFPRGVGLSPVRNGALES